ncbi:FdhF/YdeP family oxidoreductase [Pseudosulfitobacter koreensis]|uniref:FdhF/YdeP family oxidoreductase n=1 Tax=Pseudosulfitobacter koreensis TaxID=2968472 RepID=A0ABT1YX54_9RHOB|nr:FdhF/YdeP family oxidoreductase [Pseudosulfitobacter koreense]MCR8825411.1 FdhF/YdeP family oxidoreductase [Pseudosulfitobacter koreense]
MSDHDQDDHLPTEHDAQTPEYKHSTGGWGSLKSLTRIFGKEASTPEALRTLERQNKPEGVMCTSCAWAKPAKPHLAEFCENGAKATLWELTSRRCTPEFFAEHTLEELRDWHDYDLEQQGRLTHPLRYDADSDKYVAVSWEEAFAAIGAELRNLDPKSTVFYSSGHAGLEASFLYGLFARLYGHNNLPQSSNMCHETTSVGLNEIIGTPVGTCVLDDFEECDAIFFFGQNPGSNSPRFLHPLKRAVERGCKVVTFNPVRERGLIEFVDPQNLLQMTVGTPTKISTEYFQVRPGGDISALIGMIKLVLDAEDQAPGTVLDRAFIDDETGGFNEMREAVAAISWDEIEHASGLTREMLGRAADIYMQSEKVIGIYGMGLTQHVHGFQNLGMLVNLLLLRGNIGRPGAGISPVRGHSNVQGQRTVGIAEKPKLVPIEKLEEMFDFTSPRDEGMNAVAACEGLLEGSVKAMILMGGNLVRALPDRERIEEAWSSLDLTVYVGTKLNRTHLKPGKSCYLLPCLGRLDEDIQASGPQSISIECSLSHIYGSIGKAKPASEHLKSEVAIVAGMAKATLDHNPKVRWDEWTADYSLIRDLVEQSYPDDFRDYNGRMFEPGGFYRGNSARERNWQTESGKAEFTAPTVLSAIGAEEAEGRLTLITLRSNDQFNTTIYGFSDRLRGLSGSRDVILINREEMARLDLEEGQEVALVSDLDDGVERRITGLTVTPFDLPNGCIGGYYPEMNVLVPLSYHDKKSQTPASKGAPVRIEA